MNLITLFVIKGKSLIEVILFEALNNNSAALIKDLNNLFWPRLFYIAIKNAIRCRKNNLIILGFLPMSLSGQDNTILFLFTPYMKLSKHCSKVVFVVISLLNHVRKQYLCSDEICFYPDILFNLAKILFAANKLAGKREGYEVHKI